MDFAAEYSKWNKILSDYNQQQLLAWWDELTSEQKTILINQLENTDLELIQKLSGLISGDESAAHSHGDYEPSKVHRLPKTKAEQKRREEARAIGEEALKNGEIGIILVAGGQSSRLQYEAPKGKFPVGPLSDRSLFQYHTEKIVALERKYGIELPWYIMTNMFSLDETHDFFAEHNYFGKSKDSIYFFDQRMLPAVDRNGRILMETTYAPALAPDGHGGLLNALKSHHLIDNMKERGLKHIFYFQVDNPLVQMCDPVFIGLHIQEGAAISAKTVKKSHPDEKLGNIVKTKDGYLVIEYTELPADKKAMKRENGELLFDQGSIGIHVFSLDFLIQAVENSANMPFHISHKTIKYLNESGELIKPKTPNGYKFEQFIFDVFTQTDNICVVEVERAREFSPIKNKEGQDSPETARRDLNTYFATILEECGYSIPRDENKAIAWRLEISPLTGWTADDLKKKLSPNFSPHDEMILEA